MREHIIPRELTARALNLTLALYRVTDLLPHEEPLRRGIREKGGEIFAAVVSARHSADFKGDMGDADHAWVATEILLGYLAMARTLGCANPLNFLVLEREYRSLRDAIAIIIEEASLVDNVRESPKGQSEKMPQPEEKKNKSVIPARSNQSRVPSVPIGRASTGVSSNGVKAPPSWTGVSESVPPMSAKTGSANDRQKTIIGHLSDKGQAKISDFYKTFDGVSSKTIQRDLQDLVARNVIKKDGDKRWTTYALV